MDKIISATKAAREFSELLNSVKFKAEAYVIERNGKPLARIIPISPAETGRELKDLRHLLRELPKLGKEIETFSNDLEEIWKQQPALPEEISWE
ncbi:MAG: type II toxin-antitoxin system prevent-host-death family antitoxin [Thermodesulfobacteriota bacterium]